jgi:serine phosphatase RsbU (regulator of sigma subunit)/PAS domain-containing protein
MKTNPGDPFESYLQRKGGPTHRAMYLWGSISFPSWYVFDYILLPQYWWQFLLVRILTIVVFWIFYFALRPLVKNRKHYEFNSTYSGTVLFMVVIGFMLPFTGEQLGLYYWGYSLVYIFAAICYYVTFKRFVIGSVIGLLPHVITIPFMFDKPVSYIIVNGGLVLITIYTGSIIVYRQRLQTLYDTFQAEEALKREKEELELAHLQLSQSNEKIKSVLDNIPEGVIIFDPDTMKILAEHSSFTVDLLHATDISHISLDALLFDHSNIQREWAQLKPLLKKNDFSLETLPSQITFQKPGFSKKYLSVIWHRLSQDSESHIMLLIRDNTSMKRLLEMEEQSAQAIQRSFISEVNSPKFSIEGSYQPAAIVGGDWYGFHYDEARNWLLIMIGDVTGHGMASALVTGAVSGAVDVLLRRTIDSPTPKDHLFHLAKELNTIVSKTSLNAGRAMSMAFLCVDFNELKLHYLNAGHTGVYLSSEKVVHGINKPGHLLGTFDNPGFGTLDHAVHYGDTIFLFTDGLFENVSLSGDRIRYQEIKNILLEGETALDIKSRLERLIHDKGLDHRLEDDFTFLVIKLERPVAAAHSA